MITGIRNKSESKANLFINGDENYKCFSDRSNKTLI